jgi:transcriptional regulator with XRE-family HTH domain
MDMIINLNTLIKEKNKRAWTQGHLAEVCGLSLRTIQRIEKSGVASHETIQALASVFEISIEELITQESHQKMEPKPTVTSQEKLGFINYFSILMNGKRIAVIGLILIMSYLGLLLITYFFGGPGIKIDGITLMPKNHNSNITLYYISSILSFFTLLPGIILLSISQKFYKFNKAWSYWIILVASIAFVIANIKIGIFVLIWIALMINWFAKKQNAN